MTDGHTRKANNIFAARSARRKEVGDAELTSFALARERKTLDLALTLWRFVKDDLVAVALAGEVTIYCFGLKPSFANDLVLKFEKDRPVLFFDQPAIVGGRGGFQLPLVFKQRQVVDVLEDFLQVKIFSRVHAIKFRLGQFCEWLHPG